MIVTQGEIEFVVRAKGRHLARPVERGDQGELLPCPVEEGTCLSLQTKPFEKGVKVTVTKASLSEDRLQWLIEVVLGNHSGFYASHRERYLKAKGIGLTDDPRKAVKGEPAVTTDEQLQIARIAREKRELEAEQAWRLRKQKLERLLAEMRADAVERTDREAEGDIRFIERRLAKMDRRRQEKQAAFAA